MKAIHHKEGMKSFEKIIVWGDTPPWDAFYRTIVGYVTIPAMWRLFGGSHSEWILVPFLLGVLFMLRLVPAVIRRVVPFSAAVQDVWTERRQTAKHYDSFQWQKLMWIGVGIGLYTAHSGQYLNARIAAALFCVLSGALGLARWRSVAPRPEPAPVAVKRANEAV